MRTIEILKNYNAAEKNHWKLMCDLSNDDIHYFSGREFANLDFDYYLKQSDKFDKTEIIEWINYQYNETLIEIEQYKKENNTQLINENYQGYLDELNLLKRICKQNY